MDGTFTLTELGWKAFFAQQLDLDELTELTPVRIFEQHRSRYTLASEQGIRQLTITPSMPALAVGDWLLLDAQGHWVRELERASLFSRKAPGNAVSRQLIAANVDTVFIVSSLNDNFKLSRIERYLSLAHEARVEPVVVLTRADCCANSDDYLAQVQALDNRLLVQAVNALDTSSVEVLRAWCKTGQTVAFLGSSGVGKSTLINTLLGTSQSATGSIRDADSKGRHTTTARAIYAMRDGALLLDTPGMRELQLADCEDGVSATFADITELVTCCRFTDCEHQSEPGCAVQAAIVDGDLAPRRLDNYRKLMREQQLNAATLAEKRASGRELTKLHRAIQNSSRQHKKGE